MADIDWQNPAVQKVFGIDDETSAKMHRLYDEAQIEWHCEGRHGVVRHVEKSRWQEVQKMLEWFYGGGCCRWTKEPGGTYATEFVHMTKVYPPPTKPWEWCGETVLFADWKNRLTETRAKVRTFREGQRVSFEHGGRTHTGLVASVNDKTVSVIVEGEGRWRVSPDRLTVR